MNNPSASAQASGEYIVICPVCREAMLSDGKRNAVADAFVKIHGPACTNEPLNDFPRDMSIGYYSALAAHAFTGEAQ